MNVLRNLLIQKISPACQRCSYQTDQRILKLRSPVSRKGKGDSTYWSECTQLFESDPSGFEVICPNCLEIEKVNKKISKPKGPSGARVDPLPNKVVVWSGEGFGQAQAWADIKRKDGYDVLFLKDNQLYLYPIWDTPLHYTPSDLARWFNLDVGLLYYGDECVTLERV